MATNRFSLRTRFSLWTSIAIVASTLGLTWPVYSVSTHALTAQANEEMERIVSSTTEALDLWLGSRERDVLNFSELSPLIAACGNHDLSAGAQQTLDRIQGRSPFYGNVFLADPAGKIFLDSIGGKSVGIDLMGQERYRPNAEHARLGEMWTGNAIRSAATGRPVIVITAPVRAGDEFVGILGTTIELANFADQFVKDHRVGRTGYLFMFDSAGTIVADPDPAKILRTNNAQTDYGRKMLSQDSGSIEYDLDGTWRTAYFRHSRIKGWTVGASVPTAELMSGVRTVQMYLGVFGILTIISATIGVSTIAGKVSRVLNNVISDLSGSADRFNSAASQIAQTSQGVAEGASQQAASIEETSAAADEVTAVTQANRERTSDLAAVMKEAGASFEVMDESMEHLVRWMGDFKQSSEKVSKIVKAIDEIAFQTNILALNAAVEAARAGDAGMGFAVVADEVRNLARRSAEAARDTSALIQESIDKTARGQVTVDQCAKAMATNSVLAKRVVQLTQELDGATSEQVRGIDMIAKSVARIQQTTMQNAASAEESASASQELNAQSAAVRGVLAELHDFVHGHAESHVA